jgi:hypothetical protein
MLGLTPGCPQQDRGYSVIDRNDALIELLNISDRKELCSYCDDLVITRSSLVDLILLASVGDLTPYRYKKFCSVTVPEHLELKSDHFSAVKEFDVNSRPAEKLISKTFQQLKERRLFVSHLFYTPCFTYWHLFYFDQRDQEEECQNHWAQGPHIHFLNFLLLSRPLVDVMAAVAEGKMNFGEKRHIRCQTDTV